MPICKFCQIDVVDGTTESGTDSNKCSHGIYYNAYWNGRACCNCYTEKIGWANYDKYACLQCKTRAAQKAATDPERMAEIAAVLQAAA